jgi:hypothetical protein
MIQERGALYGLLDCALWPGGEMTTGWNLKSLWGIYVFDTGTLIAGLFCATALRKLTAEVVEIE